MTRIVAGSAKGRRLAVPPRGTRPTSERAREALFNTLRSYLDIAGAHVLDLFAGTGAVGLEALSRGAETAAFVESDRPAADVLRRNIDMLDLPGATLHRRQAAVFLAAPGSAAPGSAAPGSDEPYDLVFCDPPYAYPDELLAALLQALTRPGRLAPDAVVVVERAARGTEPRWPASIALVTQRRYGEGVLWYGRPHRDEHSRDQPDYRHPPGAPAQADPSK